MNPCERASALARNPPRAETLRAVSPPRCVALPPMLARAFHSWTMGVEVKGVAISLHHPTPPSLKDGSPLAR